MISGLISVYSFNTYGAIWSVSHNAIRMKGKLSSADPTNLQKMLARNPGIKKLVVTSPGGNVDFGLALGKIIQSYQLEIIVDGMCMSSCANYLFLAGAKKYLSASDGAEGTRGVVCYHGTSKTSVTDRWESKVIELRNRGISPEQIEAYRKKSVIQAQEEGEFFESIGVDGDTLHTRSPGYKWVCPSASGFRSMGVSVEGEMDRHYLDSLNSGGLRAFIREDAPVNSEAPTSPITRKARTAR